MKTVILSLLLAGIPSIAMSNQDIPIMSNTVSEECIRIISNRNVAGDNMSIGRPENERFLYVEQYHPCYRYVDGQLVFESVPTYWRPGKKLPHKVRRKIEFIFKNKITEVKGKGQFKNVLSHMIGAVSQAKFPGVYSLLSKVGLFKDKYNRRAAANELKNTLIDVVLTYQLKMELKYLRLPEPNHSSGASTTIGLGSVSTQKSANAEKSFSENDIYKDGLDALLYYGLQKAHDFNVIEGGATFDVLEKTNEISALLNSKNTYNEREKALSEFLDSLNLTIF